MFLKNRQNVFKKSSKCFQKIVKMFLKNRQNVFKKSSKCFQKIVKMFSNFSFQTQQSNYSHSSGLHCTINIVTALEASFTTVRFNLQHNFTAVKVTAQAARAVNYELYGCKGNSTGCQSRKLRPQHIDRTIITRLQYRLQLFRGLYYKT